MGGGVGVGEAVGTSVGVAVAVACDVGLAERSVQAEISSKPTEISSGQYTIRSIIGLYGRTPSSAIRPMSMAQPNSPSSEHIEESDGQRGGTAQELWLHELELVLRRVDTGEIIGQEEDHRYPSPLERCVIAAGAGTQGETLLGIYP